MREWVRVIVELATVGGIGLGIALAANALNPDGLDVTRDYFRSAATAGARTASTDAAPQQTVAEADSNENQKHTKTRTESMTVDGQEDSGAAGAAAQSADNQPEMSPYAEQTLQQIQAAGLQTISHEEVVEVFKDPMTEMMINIFIDARDDYHYREGHIPGAWQVDYYYIDRYIDRVLPVAQAAEKIIVYCNGGECEDSKLVAQALRDDYFINPDALYVYVGGMERWRETGMPIERGQRLSGDIIQSDEGAGS